MLLAFLWVLEDSNAGPHSCSANTLPTEPSPQPKTPFTSVWIVLMKVPWATWFMWKFTVGLISGPLCPMK